MRRTGRRQQQQLAQRWAEEQRKMGGKRKGFMESGEGNVWWEEVPSLVRAHVSLQRCESPANTAQRHDEAITLCLRTAPRSVIFAGHMSKSGF
jgi:hypothetical protein